MSKDIFKQGRLLVFSDVYLVRKCHLAKLFHYLPIPASVFRGQCCCHQVAALSGTAQGRPSHRWRSPRRQRPTLWSSSQYKQDLTRRHEVEGRCCLEPLSSSVAENSEIPDLGIFALITQPCHSSCCKL